MKNLFFMAVSNTIYDLPEDDPCILLIKFTILLDKSQQVSVFRIFHDYEKVVRILKNLQQADYVLVNKFLKD